MSTDPRITYGGSMGGYAAIKYSKLLQASHIISLCPQYSIDPEECDKTYNFWSKYYTAALHGMSIKSDDVAGKLAIFYDPYDKVDTYHYKKIQRENGGAEAIHVPYVGHHVTSVFAGTNNLLFLIAASRHDNIIDMKKFARSLSRFSKFRIERILRFAREKLPKKAAQVVVNLYRRDPSVMLYLKYDDIKFIISKLRIQTERMFLCDFLVALSNVSTRPTEQLAAIHEVCLLRDERLVLLTAHGTRLQYDFQRKEVVHSNEVSENYADVYIEVVRNSMSLFVTFNGNKIYLFVDDNGQIKYCGDHDDSRQVYFLMSSSRPGWFELTWNATYLSAQENGSLLCNRAKPMAWERFQFSAKAA